MTINVDGLMGFYLTGAIVLFALALFAFVASRNEKSTKKR